MDKKKIGIIGAVLFTFIIYLTGVYTVQEGTVAVEDTFGKYNVEEIYPGLHFKIPFVQGKTIMDIKVNTVNYIGNKVIIDEDDGDGVTQRSRITILDAKNLPIGLDVTVQYRPDASEMSMILSEYGKNYFDKKVNSIIRSSIRDSASGYSAETISARRTEMGIAMQSNLSDAFASLPFILEKVALRDIVLPAVIRNKVVAVQEAKQEEQRLDQVEKQALVKKRIEIINAERVAEVARLQAAGQADANIENARGNAEAIKLVSTEQAKANERINKTLTPTLVQQNWVQQWNGVQPQYMLSDNANLLLNIGK